MKKFITKVMKEFKKPFKDNKAAKSFDKNRVSIYFEENRLTKNQPYLMPLCIMRTNPCFWLKSGGCTVCGYQLNTSSQLEFSDENILNQVKYIIKILNPEKYPLITVTSSGSFLDSREINEPLRKKMLVMLRDAGFKYFNFECRPEFLLNEKKIIELKNIFPVEPSVGIGLESENQFIRDVCMHKGFKTDTYLKATKMVEKHGIIHDAYILYGKPFLNEKESVEDAIKTIKFAFKHGANWAIIMIANLQPYTLSHWLWKRDEYKLPNLWGLFDIIDAFPEEQRDRILIKGHYRAVPEPLAYATSCEKCTHYLVDAFNKWDLTGDMYHLDRVRNICDCRSIWKKKLEACEDATPLKERMKEQINKISLEMFNNPYQEKNNGEGD